MPRLHHQMKPAVPAGRVFSEFSKFTSSSLCIFMTWPKKFWTFDISGARNGKVVTAYSEFGWSGFVEVDLGLTGLPWKASLSRMFGNSWVGTNPRQDLQGLGCGHTPVSNLLELNAPNPEAFLRALEWPYGLQSPYWRTPWDLFQPSLAEIVDHGIQWSYEPKVGIHLMGHPKPTVTAVKPKQLHDHGSNCNMLINVMIGYLANSWWSPLSLPLTTFGTCTPRCWRCTSVGHLRWSFCSRSWDTYWFWSKIETWHRIWTWHFNSKSQG